MKKLAVVVVMVMGLMAGCAMAALPDTGANVEGLMTEGITAMGAIAVVAVGGYIAFKIVKKALDWVGRAFGGGDSYDDLYELVEDPDGVYRYHARG